jgi:hypothetical protein
MGIETDLMKKVSSFEDTRLYETTGVVGLQDNGFDVCRSSDSRRGYMEESGCSFDIRKFAMIYSLLRVKYYAV